MTPSKIAIALYSKVLRVVREMAEDPFLSALKLLLLAICVYVTVFVIFNYTQNWTHPELPMHSYDKVLKKGHLFSPRDFKLMFDMDSFNWAPRPRLLSHLQEIWNIKFRVLLFRHLPSHPSLSLSWVWVLIVSPYFLFRLIKNISDSTYSPWIGLIIYFSSTAALSGLTMMFRPAKVLTIAFSLMALYTVSAVKAATPGQDWFPRRFRTLAAILLAGFLSDETFVITYLALPIIFPIRLGFFPFQTKRCLFYLSIFPAFAVLALYIIPLISLSLGYMPEFTNILSSMRLAGDESVYSFQDRMGRFNPGALLFALGQLTQYQLTPPSLFTWHDLTSGSFAAGTMKYFAVYATIFIAGSILLHRRTGAPVIRWLTATLLAALTIKFIGGGYNYYYGSVSIVFFAVYWGIYFGSARRVIWKAASFAVLIFITWCSLSNFKLANESAMQWHIPMMQQYFPAETAGMEGPKLTIRSAGEIWRHRDNCSYIEASRKDFAPIHFPFFYELGKICKRS